MSLSVERIRELASTRVFLRATIHQVFERFKVDLLAMTFSEGWLAGVDYTFSILNEYEAGGACFFEPDGTTSIEGWMRGGKSRHQMHSNDKETYVELWFDRRKEVFEGALSDWRLLQAVALASQRARQLQYIQEEKKNSGASVNALKTLQDRLGALLLSQNIQYMRNLRALGQVV